MKQPVTITALLLGVCLVGTSALSPFQSQPQSAAPKVCGDSEAVVTSVKQDLSAMVDTIKKESQSDFTTKYHEQTCLSRLSICLETTNELLQCLDKASKDSTTPPAQMEAIKTMQAAYGKLKSTLDQDIQALKSAKNPKAAKAAIGNFDFSH